MTESRLGYLDLIQRGEEYVGGLLVVDLEGDPADCSHTEPARVGRVARILFGDRLASHLLWKVFRPSLLSSVQVSPDCLCVKEPSLVHRELVGPVLAYREHTCDVLPQWTQLGTVAYASEPGCWWVHQSGKDRAEALALEYVRRTGVDALLEPFRRLEELLRSLPEKC